jgi:hypothetical protein
VSIFSFEFYNGAVPAGGGVYPLWAADATDVTIINSIDYFQEGSGVDNCYLYLNDPTLGASIVSIFQANPFVPGQWRGKLVLNPGADMGLFPLSAPWVFSISGQKFGP